MSATVGAPGKNAQTTSIQRRGTDLEAEATDLPLSFVEPILVTYRSVGIGAFGVVMRFAGMPLEKIALYMNSSQVSGRNQFAKATRLTFAEGMIAPYRVVGPASFLAWFLQYSVMGFAFQLFDHGISKMLGVKPVYYSNELMLPPEEIERDTTYKIKTCFARFISPILAATLESRVSNRAEVQRYFGPQKLAALEAQAGWSPLIRAAGPAFLPNVMRNLIMCHTTFLVTPITYKLYFPQERKSASSLFWYGLGTNIFAGNVLAITQQTLWGRSLDYAAANKGQIHYRQVIHQGLQTDGLAAFFTTPKWLSRVLMNCPAQGVLPWFYNEMLPLGEHAVLMGVKHLLYDPWLKESYPLPKVTLRRRYTEFTSDLDSRTYAEPLNASEPQ
jgi:hypothetical protein